MPQFEDIFTVPAPTNASREFDDGLRRALSRLTGAKYNLSASVPPHASIAAVRGRKSVQKKGCVEISICASMAKINFCEASEQRLYLLNRCQESLA